KAKLLEELRNQKTSPTDFFAESAREPTCEAKAPSQNEVKHRRRDWGNRQTHAGSQLIHEWAVGKCSEPRRPDDDVGQECVQEGQSPAQDGIATSGPDPSEFAQLAASKLKRGHRRQRR